MRMRKPVSQEDRSVGGPKLLEVVERPLVRVRLDRRVTVALAEALDVHVTLVDVDLDCVNPQCESVMPEQVENRRPVPSPRRLGSTCSSSRRPTRSAYQTFGLTLTSATAKAGLPASMENMDSPARSMAIRSLNTSAPGDGVSNSVSKSWRSRPTSAASPTSARRGVSSPSTIMRIREDKSPSGSKRQGRTSPKNAPEALNDLSASYRARTARHARSDPLGMAHRDRHWRYVRIASIGRACSALPSSLRIRERFDRPGRLWPNRSGVAAAGARVWSVSSVCVLVAANRC